MQNSRKPKIELHRQRAKLPNSHYRAHGTVVRRPYMEMGTWQSPSGLNEENSLVDLIYVVSEAKDKKTTLVSCTHQKNQTNGSRYSRNERELIDSS